MFYIRNGSGFLDFSVIFRGGLKVENCALKSVFSPINNSGGKRSRRY